MKIKANAPIIKGVIRDEVLKNARPVVIEFRILSPATTPIAAAVEVAVMVLKGYLGT